MGNGRYPGPLQTTTSLLYRLFLLLEFQSGIIVANVLLQLHGNIYPSDSEHGDVPRSACPGRFQIYVISQQLPQASGGMGEEMTRSFSECRDGAASSQTYQRTDKYPTELEEFHLL